MKDFCSYHDRLHSIPGFRLLAIDSFEANLYIRDNAQYDKIVVAKKGGREDADL